jgi:hypothetical protein
MKVVLWECEGYLENTALMKRAPFINTFGQVFTASFCAENITVKYDTLKMAPTCAETRS